jgi:hypothetical protein
MRKSEQERIEREEYVRRVRAGENPARATGSVLFGEGTLVSEPTDESPCPFHEAWHPPRRLPTQPRSLLECPYCRDAKVASRKRSLEEPEVLQHPQHPQGDGRMAQAWADHLAANKDELIASGAVHLVDRELADRVVARIDNERYDELADLKESPTVSALFMHRMRKHRRHWRRHA